MDDNSSNLGSCGNMNPESKTTVIWSLFSVCSTSVCVGIALPSGPIMPLGSSGICRCWSTNFWSATVVTGTLAWSRIKINSGMSSPTVTLPLKKGSWIYRLLGRGTSVRVQTERLPLSRPNKMVKKFDFDEFK